MRSSFFGLETLLRALQTQQQALDTVNHNIANANTEGYSKQEVQMQATTPWTGPSISPVGAGSRPSAALNIGTGVMAIAIKRSRSAFVDSELRAQSQSQAYWDQIASGMDQIEGLLVEPTDQGIGDLISRYFQSWQELSNNPESTAVRTVVREQAISLAGALNTVHNQLMTLQNDYDRQIASYVPELNDIIGRIAALNDEIVRQEAPAQPVPGIPRVAANDLRDRRDLLLDQLVDLTNATYTEDDRGVVTVRIGGRVVVADNYQRRVVTTTVAVSTDGVQNLVTKLLWEDSTPSNMTDNLEVEVDGGKLQALIELRGKVVPDTDPANTTGLKLDGRVQAAMNQLNLLARSIAVETNALHSTGYGLDVNADPAKNQRNFWAVPSGGTSAITARNLAVDDRILGKKDDDGNTISPPDSLGGLRKIAAAQSGADADGDGKLDTPGDNRIALQIAQLLQRGVTTLQGTSLHDYYASVVGQLGADTRHAETMRDNQQLLTDHLKRRRESIQGVSIDEEAAKLIQFQRAYQAAARGITVLDEMLDLIINRMGVVGR